MTPLGLPVEPEVKLIVQGGVCLVEVCKLVKQRFILCAAGFKINRRPNRVKIFHGRIGGANIIEKFLFIFHFGQIAIAKKINVAYFRSSHDFGNVQIKIYEYSDCLKFLNCEESQNPICGIDRSNSDAATACNTQFAQIFGNNRRANLNF